MIPRVQESALLARAGVRARAHVRAHSPAGRATLRVPPVEAPRGCGGASCRSGASGIRKQQLKVFYHITVLSAETIELLVGGLVSTRVLKLSTCTALPCWGGAWWRGGTGGGSWPAAAGAAA